MPTVTPTPIPLFTTPFPDPSDRSSYGVRGRALWSWEVVQAVPGMNLLSTQTLANAQASKEFADMAAGISNYAGRWEDLTGSLNVPAAVFHDGFFWVLLANIADVTTQEPAEPSLYWARFDEDSVARSGDTMTGPLEVPAGATGSQVPRSSETIRNRGGAAALPVWNTAGRPATPEDGDSGFNTDLEAIETYRSGVWVAPKNMVVTTPVALTGSGVTLSVPDSARYREIEVVIYEANSPNTNIELRAVGGTVTYTSSCIRLTTGGGTNSSTNSSTGSRIWNSNSGLSGGGFGRISLIRRSSNTVWDVNSVVREGGTICNGAGIVNASTAITSVSLDVLSGTWSGGFAYLLLKP